MSCSMTEESSQPVTATKDILENQENPRKPWKNCENRLKTQENRLKTALARRLRRLDLYKTTFENENSWNLSRLSRSEDLFRSRSCLGDP